MSLYCTPVAEWFGQSASPVTATPGPETEVNWLRNQAPTQCLPPSAIIALGIERALPNSLRELDPIEDWVIHQTQVLKRMDGFGAHAARVLGAGAMRRLEEFKKYKGGWDSGRGKPLSTTTISLVDTFANKYSAFGRTAPSLFLTRDGNLQLSWEDEGGQSLEVEFFPDKLEFYIGGTDEEGTIDINPENPINALEELIKRIS